MIFMELNQPQNLPNQKHVKLFKHGLVDENVYEYELVLQLNNMDLSTIKFGKDDTRRSIFFYMIATTTTHRNQGFAKELLDAFFRMIKKMNYSLCIDSYTAAGEIYVRHVIEDLAKKYGVRMIKC